VRLHPISAADHIVLEKIGGLEPEEAFNKQGWSSRGGTSPLHFGEES